MNTIHIYLGYVESVEFINDGTQFVSASRDGKIILVDVHSLQVVN